MPHNFVRSFVSTNCTPHATIPFFSSHDRHTGRNVCIAYGDARCYGFEKLYVPVQFFNSSLLCKLARPAAFRHRMKTVRSVQFSTRVFLMENIACRNVRGKRLASGVSPAAGIGIAHPCAIPTSSLLRKLGYLQHFRPRVGTIAATRGG